MSVTAATLAGAPAALRAQSNVRTIEFADVSTTSLSWPTFIAQAQGYDTANGVKLDISVAGSAAKTAQQLIAGASDIVVNSTSQVIEAVAGGASMTIVAVNDIAASYAIMAKKSVATMKGLKGKQFIVGGPNDITRVYSDEALVRAGVNPDDVTYTYAGGSGDRFAALMSGGVDAAILAPPFNFMAERNGYVMIDAVYKEFSSFPIGNFAVNPAWAKKNQDVLVSFLRMHLMGVRDFYNPALRQKSIQALIDATHANPDDAAKTYDYLRSITFFSPSGVASAADMNRVVNTLIKTGDVKAPPPPLERYTDFHYAVIAGRGIVHA
jgi:ABC-type nitrate/sulfonate/bicarbonate transport system substrate-binding protein